MTSAVAFTAADLSFDKPRHQYRLPDGRLVPSVTTILRDTRVSVDFDAIAATSRIREEQIERRRELGSLVHDCCHAFDDGDLDWDELERTAPECAPYVVAWQTFRVNSGVEPLVRERMVFHQGQFYCGTLDGVFRLKLATARRILIDIKIGKPEDAAAQFQTAAYHRAYEEEHPDEPIDERWAVQLTPERAIPYRITPYADWSDYPKFQAFLVTWREQADRRGR